MITIALASIILLFGFVVFFGAPYLPTFRKQAEQALDLLDLKPGQTMLELGCGDGRLLVQAASRGVYAIGYELNPLLVIIAKIRTWPYRHLVKVHFANYWAATWPKTDGIYVFLLEKYMKKLDKKIIQDTTKPVRLVSYAFEITDKVADSQSGGFFRYDYL